MSTLRLLGCLDGVNAEVLGQAISQLWPSASGQQPQVGLLYVIDTRPRGELERRRERFWRPPHLPLARQEQLRQAERETAQEILQEGARYVRGAELLQREGRAEQEILRCAQEWGATLIVLCARSPRGERGPEQGPASVGHVARFVLDHASCPVLLLRGSWSLASAKEGPA
ncbi:universal stress protein [Thermogemmatispora sp.]|uniref:universal stress protein n=1 Tax=Thermogemmatispora sp. TaxID=1968838 RepID=UPI001D28F41F|nr:universal stress protein [Thermogemmatispora sp.]MBX5448498.1 universal stress protein [Thermogemmatispora sp.]